MKANHILGTIAGLCLLGAAVCACTNAGDPSGTGGEATVTFETNGGGAVAPVTVGIGGTIAKPTDPASTAGGAANRFRGWYTDNETFKNEYDFTSRVLRDITLYADWGYRPGDVGPGGGKIFYRADDGFQVLADTTSTYTEYTAYYLEAAPDDEGYLTWGPPGQGGGGGLPNDVATAGYGNGIGAGRKNTAVILKPGRVPDSPAALACQNAAHGSRADWFLPSRNEIDELFKNRAVVDNLKTAAPATNFWYWTSNQFDDEFVYAKNFSTGSNNTFQNATRNVRAIRAF
jgi:hypothetical protein